MTTWACYPHGTRIEQDEKPTFDCSDADRSSCWWEKVTPQPKEQHAHNMHILGLIRDEPAWALSRILLTEQLGEAVTRYDDYAHDLIRAAIDAGIDRDLIDRGLLLRTRYVSAVGAARRRP